MRRTDSTAAALPFSFLEIGLSGSPSPPTIILGAAPLSLHQSEQSKNDGYKKRPVRGDTAHVTKYRTPRPCVPHAFWGNFPSSIARHPRGCQYRTNTEPYVFEKLSTRCSQLSTFFAPTRFQLWTYRPWKIGPGGEGDIHDIHRLIRKFVPGIECCVGYVLTYKVNCRRRKKKKNTHTHTTMHTSNMLKSGAG